MQIGFKRAGVLAALCFTTLASTALRAAAATRTVTSSANSGAGSLRDTVAAAAASDTIVFDAAVTGAITLSGGEIALTKDLTINGPASGIIINGTVSTRIFNVASGVTVHLSRLNLRNGHAVSGGAILNAGSMFISNCNFGDNGATNGGAISNASQILMDNCTFSGNSATQSGGAIQNAAGGALNVSLSSFSGNSAANGGAANNIESASFSKCTFKENIASQNGGAVSNGFPSTPGGAMTLSACTLSGNMAANGGALENVGFLGNVQCNNSTFSGNSATFDGGGARNTGSLTLRHCTITGNDAAKGGGLVNSTAISALAATRPDNCIIADNSAANGPDVSGDFNSSGYNLVGESDGATGFTGSGDQSGTTASPLGAKLGPLTDNGGPTFTHAPLLGSPALDLGKAGVLPTDQRGLTRPFDDAALGNAGGGDGSDIGAIEMQSHVGAPLTLSDVTLTEGNSGTINATITVTLTAAIAQSASVDYATSDGTAAAGSDYTVTGGTLTFAPGETSKTVTVPVVGDTIDEANEVFSVNFKNAVNSSLPDVQCLVTINDDDAAPTLAVSDPVSQKEGSAAAPGSATFTVTLSAPSGKSITVNYNTTDGATNGATAANDYIGKTGILAFLPGETSKTVKITFKGDAVAELNEPFFFDIKTPSNATIADGRGATYIKNDDGPSVTIANAVTVDEGNSGTKAQTFTVTLSAASTDTVTVNYTTANGTAGPADYTVQSGVLTFAPGETSKVITVLVKGDTTVEPTETYKVNLVSPKYAILADSQGSAYIRNDDTAPLLFEDAPSE